MERRNGNEEPVPGVPGYRVRSFASLGSTNTAALDAARAGDPGQLWIVADEQTQGRARRGRSWSSERGNLYATVLWIDPAPAEHLGELPMVAGVALADAVEAACGRIGLVRLKWPNDLLIEDKKISGILLEALPLPGGNRAVVCGFGVNCSHHPDLGLYPATALSVLGHAVSPERMFALLARAVAARIEQWGRGAGFGAIRADWLARAVGLGGPITVRLSNRELGGRFEGIETDGRLQLKKADGRIELVSAGDVFFT